MNLMYLWINWISYELRVHYAMCYWCLWRPSLHHTISVLERIRSVDFLSWRYYVAIDDMMWAAVRTCACVCVTSLRPATCLMSGTLPLVNLSRPKTHLPYEAMPCHTESWWNFMKPYSIRRNVHAALTSPNLPTAHTRNDCLLGCVIISLGNDVK